VNILVTGGAGFIGSHLCEFLLNKGEKVFCIDNFFTGSKENVKDLIKKDKFTLLPHDIVNPLFLNEHIDQVYNLACPASPIHYQHNGIRTIKANTLGVTNMLGLAKLHQARILQASTSEVYGDPAIHPQEEHYWGNVNCFGPRACYDEGKRAAEAFFFQYKEQHNVDIRIARIFNTYGPKMAINDGRVVSNFIIQALKDEDITIYGDGTRTRSFCYVDDLVLGLYELMQCSYTKPLNLGNPGEFTMQELAEKVVGKTGSKSKITYHPIPEDDPQKRRPDITKANLWCMWQPKISLDKGLDKTIEYFKGKV